MHGSAEETRVTVTVARVLAVLAAALAVLAVALPLVGGHDYLAQLLGTPEVVVALSFAPTGALLVGSRQAHGMGWLLLTIGFFAAVYTASVSWTAFALEGNEDAALPAGATLATATAWLSLWTWWPAWGLVSMVLLQVVPRGRALGPLWRIPVWLALAFIATGSLVFAFEPGPTGAFPAIDNPAAWPALTDALGPVVRALTPIDVVLATIGVVALIVRVVRADGVERRQVGWVGYAVALTVALVFVLPGPFANLAVLLVPVGIAVAALRYRLYDLDVVANRTLVALLLLGGAAVAYVALVAWVGALVGTSAGPVPFLAAFGIALVFHPARLGLQRWVDRLFFGRRGDPYSLLRDLDRTLREAATPREALGDAVRLLRTGLRLPGVEVAVRLPGGGELAEPDGTMATPTTVVPLTLHEQQVGELRAAGRGRAPLGGTDVRVLHTLAGPLASAAYALRLTGDLEESRRGILATREDERRRLRRDLHDGLGPQLAGVVMGLDVVGSALSRGEVERAEALTTGVAEQVRSAVADVRRLVAGLRPPVLDDLGLLGALQAFSPVGDLDGTELRVSGSGDLEALPAAVEVAAYRIASEAVTNAMRHAEASRIEVDVRADRDVVCVRVCDDGQGMADEVRAGIGLVSMRERAAELGGRCTISSSAAGTTVLAELPVGAR